jgi:hypothetical protein
VTKLKRSFFAAVTLCLSCVILRAQSAAPTPQSSPAAQSAVAKPDLKDGAPAATSRVGAPPLRGVNVSGPEEAARKAAADLARKKDTAAGASAKSKPGAATKATPKTAKQDESPSAPSVSIGEFQPVPNGSDSGKSAIRLGSHSKTAGGRVHGQVYGSGGVSERDTGGAVGAESRGGKTSVYAQTGQSKDVASPPH